MEATKQARLEDVPEELKKDIQSRKKPRLAIFLDAPTKIFSPCSGLRESLVQKLQLGRDPPIKGDDEAENLRCRGRGCGQGDNGCFEGHHGAAWVILENEVFSKHFFFPCNEENVVLCSELRILGLQMEGSSTLLCRSRSG